MKRPAHIIFFLLLLLFVATGVHAVVPQEQPAAKATNKAGIAHQQDTAWVQKAVGETATPLLIMDDAEEEDDLSHQLFFRSCLISFFTSPVGIADTASPQLKAACFTVTSLTSLYIFQRVFRV